MTKTLHIAAAVIAVAAALFATTTTASAAPTNPTRAKIRLSALESATLAAINNVRARHGLMRLQHSTRLSAAAKAHSVAMGRRGFFAHESANGEAFWKRVMRFYGPRGFRHWQVGENLVWAAPNLDAAQAVELWMNSPGHRQNILTAGWREIGVSAVSVPSAPGVFGGMDATIITTDFGVRR